MRVLTFTSLFPNAQQPQHGLFVRERIRALARLCDVRVIVPVPWAPPVRWLGDRYYRYSQVARAEHQDGLPVLHPRFIVAPKVFKATDGLFMAACCLPAVLRLRETFPFEIIDAHWAYPDGVAAAILANIVGVPLAITVRGDDINVFSKEFWRRRLIRRALRRADLVIALSEGLRQGVEALAVSPSRIAVISNGVNTTRFYPVERATARNRLRAAPEGRILLSVGRLHISKGYSILIEALARLKNRFPDLSVVIIGDSDHEADARPIIEATAARHGVSHRVHLVGSQSPDVLVDWYGVADLFCLPTSREGSANVLLEALACGLPCITTPVGGNPEIISNSDVGVLVPLEAHPMAEAIAYGLSRTWDKERIVARACSRTWSVVAEECYLHLSQMVRTRQQNS